MATIKVLKSIDSLNVSGTAAETDPITPTSGVFLLSASGSGVFVEIGSDPTATTDSFYIPEGTQTIITTRPLVSAPIRRIEKGDPTILHTDDFISHNFAADDLISVVEISDPTWEDEIESVEVLEVTNSTITIDLDTDALEDFLGRGFAKKDVIISGLSDNSSGVLHIAEVSVGG